MWSIPFQQTKLGLLCAGVTYPTIDPELEPTLNKGLVARCQHIGAFLLAVHPEHKEAFGKLM